jgi:hypothetical protein
MDTTLTKVCCGVLVRIFFILLDYWVKSVSTFYIIHTVHILTINTSTNFCTSITYFQEQVQNYYMFRHRDDDIPVPKHVPVLYLFLSAFYWSIYVGLY